jgi:hypothetical protein
MHSFIGDLEFNDQHFKNAPGDPTEREKMYIAPEFYQAIIKLWQLARQHEIDFNPHTTMLKALLNKARQVEHLLSEKIGQEITVLKTVDHHYTQELAAGKKELFQALFELETPLEEVAEKFKQIALQYGKKARVNPRILQDNAQELGRASRWYCSIALDVLLAYGKSPFSLLPAPTLIGHWLRLRILQNTNMDLLKKEFYQQFNIKMGDQPALDPIFQEVYSFLANGENQKSD